MAADEEMAAPGAAATGNATEATEATTATTATAATAAPTTTTTDQDLPDAGEAPADEQQQEQQQQEQQPETSPPPPPPPPPPVPGPRAARLQQLFSSSLAHTLGKVSWDNFAACYPTAAAKSPAALKMVHKAMVDRLRELCAAEFALVVKNRQVVEKLNELEVLAKEAEKRAKEAAEAGHAKQAEGKDKTRGKEKGRGTAASDGTATTGPAAESAESQSTGPSGESQSTVQSSSTTAQTFSTTTPSSAPPSQPAAPRPPHTLPPDTVLAAHLRPQRREQVALLRAKLAQVQQANAARFSLLTSQQAEAEQLVSSLEKALADANSAAALLDGDDLVADVARETRTAEVEMTGV